MTPAEVIARFRCSGRRFSGEWPCEVCRGHAEQSVAALVEHGYAIVPVAPAQPSGTIQGASESGGGISGRSDDPKAVEGLSEPQPWKGNAVVLIDGQQIPIHADLTIQPAAWSITAHLNPADELYLPLGSCVIRLPDGREGAAVVTSVQNGVCGSLSGVGPPPTSKPLAVRDTELEAARAKLTQLREYTIHRRGCLFWVRRPCDCGLAALAGEET